jgi:drug/metabolite transporter (DMT)-like permease
MTDSRPPAARHRLDNAYLYLTFAALLWSGNSIAGRLIVGEASPMVVTSFRWLLTSSVLATFALPSIATDWRSLRPALPRLMLLGAVGYTGFNALFYVAAHTTTAINISILQGAIPIFVFLITWLVLRQQLSLGQIGGLVLGIIGILAVATDLDPVRLLAMHINLGDAFIIAASLIYAIYTIMLRHRPAAQAVSLFAVMAAAATVAALPLLGLEVAAGTVQWPTTKGWLILAYIALFPSFLAQLAYMRAVSLIGPARAGLFTNLVPVIGSLMGAGIGEAFGLAQMVGLALVVGGILIAERFRDRTQ